MLYGIFSVKIPPPLSGIDTTAIYHYTSTADYHYTYYTRHCHTCKISVVSGSVYCHTLKDNFSPKWLQILIGKTKTSRRNKHQKPKWILPKAPDYTPDHSAPTFSSRDTWLASSTFPFWRNHTLHRPPRSPASTKILPTSCLPYLLHPLLHESLCGLYSVHEGSLWKLHTFINENLTFLSWMSSSAPAVSLHTVLSTLTGVACRSRVF